MKLSLVTGASSGIGRATAVELVRRGHRVVGVGRDWARLDAVQTELGAAFVPLAIDLTATGAAGAAVEQARAALGGLDSMVVAHGVAEHRALAAIDEALLERHLAANLVAPLMLTKAFARLCTPPATVVLVASTLAHRPAPTTTAYAASKAALLAASKALAQELWPSKIRVATVSPGLVDTEMIAPLRLAPDEPMPVGAEVDRRRAAQRDALAALAPIGRLGRADEVASAIAFVLESELAVGTDLVLDGGLLVRA